MKQERHRHRVNIPRTRLVGLHETWQIMDRLLLQDWNSEMRIRLTLWHMKGRLIILEHLTNLPLRRTKLKQALRDRDKAKEHQSTSGPRPVKGALKRVVRL